MNFEEYLGSIPMLHTWDNGKTWNSGGFDADHLRRLHSFLQQALPSGSIILETGAGNSTIALSFLSPARHTVICPDEGVISRVKKYFETFGLPIDQLDIWTGFSEWILPNIAANTKEDGPKLDFSLIDGSHNWPVVFVDFCYINFMLRQGGYLMIDDIQLHSVKELGRLLVEQPEFDLVLDLGKSLVFRKNTADRQLGEWNQCPYIARLSQIYASQPNPYAL